MEECMQFDPESVKFNKKDRKLNKMDLQLKQTLETLLFCEYR